MLALWLKAQLLHWACWPAWQGERGHRVQGNISCSRSGDSLALPFLRSGVPKLDPSCQEVWYSVDTFMDCWQKWFYYGLRWNETRDWEQPSDCAPDTSDYNLNIVGESLLVSQLQGRDRSGSILLQLTRANRISRCCPVEAA